ncbi:MAG: beta-lactamase family protein, partial [Deltaproteobacteria bacterium]|nr:beta-lactamase family protein [Deltaproteobacteria bacterium]
MPLRLEPSPSLSLRTCHHAVLAALATAALTACSGDGDFASMDVEEEDAEELYEVAKDALTPTDPTTLAFPEYDLGTNTGTTYLAEADEAAINTIRNSTPNYRLLSVDAVPGTSPQKFSATFISNTGSYARSGGGWDPVMTEAELLALKGDTTRRIVSVSSYLSGTTRTYAAVWVSNTGTQQRQYDLILHQTPAAFLSAVTSYNGRVVDVSTQRRQACSASQTNCAPTGAATEFEVTGVMIRNTGADARVQTIGTGTAQQIGVALNGLRRVLDISPTQTAGSMYYVAEAVAMDPELSSTIRQDERSWWVSDLFYTDKNNIAHPDSVAHQPDRFQGRYGKLVGYNTTGGRRYAGVVFENGNHGALGTSNVGNTTLDEIDRKVQKLMKKWGIPGTVLAIVQNGRLVHAKGYGRSDVGKRFAAKPTDLYGIGSVSKPVLGSLVLRMIEANRFTLATKPFGQIYTDYVAPSDGTFHLSDIQMKHLMEHSANTGPLFQGNPASAAWWRSQETEFPTQVFALAGGPGVGATYQNPNFNILADVIKRNTNTNYTDYLNSAVIAPLGNLRIRPAHTLAEADAPGTLQAVHVERPLPLCH